MRVIVGSIQSSKVLKNKILDFIKAEKKEVIDLSREDDDFVSLTLDIVKEIRKNPDDLAIIIDEYGVGSFIVATKVKGIIAANVSEERSAYMTRSHNNARVLTLGSLIVGEKLAINIVNSFIYGKYDAGRHQIRVDMLNKMC
ncbi:MULTISPECIES: galactose-6-phosphate isomerase subunit LacA [Helcococcus]|uniref:Galactose-6-phosphate isomerase subunit LacA n=1 Tax=Helcococcus bovis TaxID=3153252 RepID=A0ABW9F7C2_9FIRM